VDEVPVDSLRDAVRDLYGCEPKFVESVSVTERLKAVNSSLAVFADADGPDTRTLWRGTVCVFDLVGHPTATRCYAWIYATPESEAGRKFVAVLHGGRATSPEKAVRVAIVESQFRRGPLPPGDPPKWTDPR